MRKTTAVARAGRSLPSLASAASIGSSIGSSGAPVKLAPKTALPKAGKPSDVPAGMIRSKLTGLLYDKPNSPAGWAQLETIDSGVQEIRDNKARRAAEAAERAKSAKPERAPFTVPEGVNVSAKDRQLLEEERNRRSEKAWAVESRRHPISGELQDTPGLIVTKAGNRLYEDVTDVGKKLGGWTGGHVAGLVGGAVQAVHTIVGGTLQLTDPRSTFEEEMAGGGEALFETVGGEVIGKLLKVVGKPAWEAAKKSGMPAVEKLVEQVFRTSGRATRETAEKLMRESEMKSVKSSMARQVAAPPQAAPGVAAMAGKRRKGKAPVAPTYFDTLTPADRDQVYKAGYNTLEQWIAQVDDADVYRIPVDPKASAVARLAREELARRQAFQPQLDAMYPDYKRWAESGKSHADHAAFVRVHDLSADEGRYLQRRFKIEQSVAQRNAERGRVTTDETTLDDFTATFEEFAGMDTTPKDADRLIAAMRELGMPEEKVTAAAASLNPVLEYGRRQGLPIGDILVRAAYDLDPSGKLRQEWAAPFFSKLEQVVLSKVPNRASGVQIKNTLIAAGVKPEELQYTGIGRMLDEAGVNPVSKDDIVSHLQDGQVRVEVVERGGSPFFEILTSHKNGGEWARFSSREDALAHAESLGINIVTNPGRLREVLPGGNLGDLKRTLEVGAPSGYAFKEMAAPNGDGRTIGIQREPGLGFYTAREIMDGALGRYAQPHDYELARRIMDWELDNKAPKPTKFGQYTLPGGEPGSYREMLITLPIRNERTKLAEQFKAKYGTDRWGEMLTPEEADAYERVYDVDKKTNFTQGHWDEPNVLAHVRFDTRVGPNGEKILHVAEVQSDWHQKGRKQGYAHEMGELPPGFRVRRVNAADVADGVAEESQIGRWGLFGGPDEEIVGMAPGTHTLEQATREFVENAPEGLIEEHGGKSFGVPDAPFKKTWHELAMKRVMRYAAENDFDSITWDVGATQADRYDLSKRVDSINVTYLPDGKYQLSARPVGGGAPVDVGIKSAAELPDVVGNELARKITDPKNGMPILPELEVSRGVYKVTSPTGEIATFNTRADAMAFINKQLATTRRSFSGVDLKVGGEGMKGFYDKILPDFVNKYTKKWGGSVESGVPVGNTNGEDAIIQIFESPLRNDSAMTYFGRLGNSALDLEPIVDIDYGAWNTKVRQWADMLATVHGGGAGPEMSLSKAFKEARENAISEADQDAIEAIEDGLKRKLGGQLNSDKDNIPVAHRLQVTPEMKAAVLNEGQPLFQTGESGIKALYDPVSRVMELGSGRADLSSVIHETGHWFHQSLLADPEFADVIRRHYGEITNVKGTEQFARHFERYLSSGKAPVAELQNVFEALRQWMRQIYERFGFGKAPKEVREIFERVYAEPSAETRRLVDRLDELSVNRDVRDPSAGSFERHMGMDDAGDFIDSVDPADDALADALEYRAARGRLMERARGYDTDDLDKIDIDDPRLDDLNDAYDEKLTQALYLKAGGKIEDFDYTNPRDLIGKYLGNKREREGLNFEDVEQLEEWLGYMTQRDTKNKSAAKSTEAQMALLQSGQMRRGVIEDDAWRRAFRDKNGNWRVLGKPVQMAGIPEDFPQPLANILLEAAQHSSGIKYIRHGDYRNSRVHGTKPKVWDSAELVTRQGFMDDMQRGEGVHVDTVFPVSVWNAVIDDLRARIAYQRDIERAADPLSVQREVSAALPDDVPLPRGSETSGRQTDVQIDRIRYGLDVIEEGETRGWSELLDKADPDRAAALVEKKATWSDQDNADAVTALARLKTRHEELLSAGMAATGDALDDAARQLRWVEKEIDDLTEAMYRSGSEQGRALASRKLTLDSNWDQVNLRVRAKMAAAEIGRDVDKGTKKYLEKVAKEIKDVETLLETTRANRAVAGMSRGRKRSLSVVKVDILRVKEELKAAAREANAGAFSTPLPPALTNPKVFKLFGQLVKLEIEAGVTRLDDLVTNLVAHLRDGGYSVDEADVRRGIAGYDKPDAPQNAAEARALLLDLKREAQLIETINAMKTGVELPKGRARARAGGAPNVEALERELAQLQKARKESVRSTAEMRRLSEKTGREAARALGEVDPAVATAKASKEAERATRAQMRAGETRQQKIDRLLAEAEARRAGTFVEPDRKASTRQPDPEMDSLREEVRQLRLDDQYRQKLTDDIGRLEGELASGEFTKRGKAQRQLSEQMARLKDKRDMLRREADQRILALRYPPTVFDRLDSLGRNMSLANAGARVVDLASNVNRAKGGAVEGLLRTGIQRMMRSLMSEEAQLAAERVKLPADVARIFSGWGKRVTGKAATQARGGDAKYGRGGFITNLTGLTDVPFRDYYERSFLSDVANNAANRGLGSVDDIFNKLVAGDSVPGFNADNIREAAKAFADRMTFNAENAVYAFIAGADRAATQKVRSVDNKAGKLAMSALQNILLRPMFRFSKVIGNVALDRIDRTPIGLIKAIASLAADGRKGALSATQAREISELAAKGIYGTALFAGGYYLAKNGLGAESDENSLAHRLQNSPFAPKVKKSESDTVYVDWGQLGQIGGDMSSFQLGYGLALIEGLSVKEDGEKDPERITARQKQMAYFRLISDMAFDQPAISGPQRYLRAKDDPGSFSKFAGSFLSSFVVPGQLRQTAVDKDAIDEQLKKTPDDPIGAWIRGLLFGTDRKSEGFLDEFKKKIPGKREELPLREPVDLRPQ